MSKPKLVPGQAVGLSLTLAELMGAQPAMVAIGDRPFADIRISFNIRRIKQKAQAELQAAEETRVALCIQYAEQTDSGEPKKVQTPAGEQFVFADRAAFDAAYRALLAESITLDGVRAMTLDELAVSPEVIGKGEDRTVITRSLTPDELFALGPFVVEP